MSLTAQLANLAGTACIPVWTGNNPKHRLNRGENRQLNTALHRIAVTQIRIHDPAKQLYQRRLNQHRDTKAGALRVLKRHLADAVFKAMNTDQQHTQTAGLHLQPAAA